MPYQEQLANLKQSFILSNFQAEPPDKQAVLMDLRKRMPSGGQRHHEPRLERQCRLLLLGAKEQKQATESCERAAIRPDFLFMLDPRPLEKIRQLRDQFIEVPPLVCRYAVSAWLFQAIDRDSTRDDFLHANREMSVDSIFVPLGRKDI